MSRKQIHREELDNSARPRWDFATVLIVVVIAIILLVLTFELWIPHHEG